MADITFYGEDLHVKAIRRMQGSTLVEIELNGGLTLTLFDEKRILKGSE